MRLRRLDLPRFGRFTDATIDFGPAPVDAPDLHIVYGPNEAGKSTALAAYLDLLFGIETRSRYNFLHPYATMRVGGALETAAGCETYNRIKRAQGSLLDGADRPVPGTVLAGALGGLDRAAYQAMFCLDDDTLEAGGRSILESRGELGQLLFAASSGLAELGRTLETITAEADGFHRPNARSGELTRLKARLTELGAERERLDTVASTYHRLVADREADRSRYDAAQAELAGLRARIATVRRQLAALPHLATLRRLRAELSPLAALPEPPEGWAAALPKLLHDEVELATRQRALADEIAAHTARRDAIAVDEPAAALAARFESLGQSRARHVTATLDIPTRQQELQAVDAEIVMVLLRLDRASEADLARLVLPARLATVLNRLAAERSGVVASLATATREHTAAMQALTTPRQALQQAGGATVAEREPGVRRLAAAAAALRGSDHRQRHRGADRALAAARLRLEHALAALQPWHGTLEALAAMAVPDAARLAGWTEALDATDRDAAKRADRLAVLDADLAQMGDEQAALVAVAGVTTDREAAALRAARDAAWAAHRRALDAETADSFADALRQDDAVTAARLNHQADVARAGELARSLHRRTAERQREEAAQQAGATRRAALTAEIATAVAGGMPGLPEAMPPRVLEVWLARRAAAVEAWEALRLAELELNGAVRDGEALCVAVRAALEALGMPPGPAAEVDGLLAAAETVAAVEERRERLREAVATAEAAAAERALALEGAARADQTWRAAWIEACAGCWLGDAEDPPEPDEARELMDVASRLVPLLGQRAELTARIAAMADDQARFADEIGDLAARLGLAPDAPIRLAEQLEMRIQAAREARALRDGHEAALATSLEQRAALAREADAHGRRRSAMLAFFAVPTLDEAAACLRAVGRRAGLREEIGTAAIALGQTLGEDVGAEGEARLAALSRETLQGELSRLEGEAGPVDEQVQEAFAQGRQSEARIAAIGGDDAVARVELQRRTTLLEVEQAAGAYLRLRAGTLAAGMALRAYRDRHRSAMMQRASAAFATISRGAYRGLASELRDREVLIALGADGGSKVADDLSKGTRFQLYLALRAAGYQEFAARHRPVPFIADDIMETFDDLRAEETFRVLGEMARVGQVIYLTHHRHLCDIAASVVPEARQHLITK
ncbi:MAG: hypothetical protein BGP12_15220 [Rhodospirillales bacterium 70-18]|nr:MAG: hypothetical protein BGP12_15220 [Rhodospirillales bacterium 70-18]